MRARSLSLVLGVAICAGQFAFAQNPEPDYSRYISGPKGCSYFDGLPGDGGAYHALDEDHMLLDYWVLMGWTIECQFDAEIATNVRPGKTETTTGVCYGPNGSEEKTDFSLTFVDDKIATLRVGILEEPITFNICPPAF